MSASSQPTGTNYLSRAFTGGGAVTCCLYFKVNAWDKAAYGSIVSIENGGSGPAFLGVGLQQDASGSGTADLLEGWYYSGSVGGSDTTATVVSDTDVWHFAAIVWDGTSYTLYIGTETGPLTPYTLTVGFNSNTANTIYVCSDSVTENADASVRGVRLWTAALDATEILAERDSATFAPVRTSDLDSFLPTSSGTNPEVASQGSDWVLTGTFADDESDPSFSAAATVVETVSGKTDFSTEGVISAPAITPEAGDRLLVFLTNDVSTISNDPTVSDDQGNTWAKLIRVDETDNQALYAYECLTPAAGISTTITADWGATVGALGIEVNRIAGGDTNAATAASNWQPTPGTGTDGVTSGSITTSGSGLLVGCSICTHTTPGGTPSVGTGFTSIESMWNYSGFDNARSEFGNYSSSPAEALFTAAGNIDHLTIGVAIANAGGGGGEVDVDAGTDTPAVTDSIASAAEYGRTPSDTVAATDSIARSAEYGRAANDTCAATDATSASLERERSAADTAAVSDSCVVALEYGRVLSDTAGVTDSTTREATISVALSDAVLVTSNATIEVELSVGDDTVSCTDAVATGVDYSRSLSDSVSCTDDVTVDAGTTKTVDVGDTASLTDATATAVDYGRALSDSASVTDSIAAGVEYGRSAQDSVTCQDSIAPEVDVSPADACSVTDSSQIEASYVRPVSDSVGVLDAASTSLEFLRAGSDSASVTDSASSQVELGRSAQDSITTSDATSIGVEYGRLLADSVTTDDDVEADTGSTLNVSVSDTVAVTDQLTASTDYVRSAADTASVTDATLRGAEFGRSAQDSVTTTDATATALELSRTVQDSVTLTDQLGIVADYVRAAQDTVAASDAIARAAEFGRLSADSVSLADDVAIEVERDSLNVVVSDAVGVTDQLLTWADYHRILADSVGTTDSIEIDTGKHPVPPADHMLVVERSPHYLTVSRTERLLAA
jgi:hypothetical protein